MRMLLSLLACLLLAFVPLGCGDDEEDGDGPEVVSQPEPASPIEDQMEAINQAIAEQDCNQFAALNFSLLRAEVDGLPPEPGATTATKDECKFLEDNVLSALEGLEFTDAQEFGAAAITEGEAPEPIGGYHHVTMLWLTDWDGEYRNLYYFPADPQVGEEPAEGVNPEPAVQSLIDSARSGRCTKAEDFIEPSGPLAQQNGGAKGACEAVAGGKIFAPAVKETPDAAPEDMGIGRDYAFYGVPTADAYFGVILATPPVDPGEPPQAEFRVIDVVPLTEVELERTPPEEREGG